MMMEFEKVKVKRAVLPIKSLEQEVVKGNQDFIEFASPKVKEIDDLVRTSKPDPKDFRKAKQSGGEKPLKRTVFYTDGYHKIYDSDEENPLVTYDRRMKHNAPMRLGRMLKSGEVDLLINVLPWREGVLNFQLCSAKSPLPSKRSRPKTELIPVREIKLSGKMEAVELKKILSSRREKQRIRLLATETCYYVVEGLETVFAAKILGVPALPAEIHKEPSYSELVDSTCWIDEEEVMLSLVRGFSSSSYNLPSAWEPYAEIARKMPKDEFVRLAKMLPNPRAKKIEEQIEKLRIRMEKIYLETSLKFIKEGRVGQKELQEALRNNFTYVSLDERLVKLRARLRKQEEIEIRQQAKFEFAMNLMVEYKQEDLAFLERDEEELLEWFAEDFMEFEAVWWRANEIKLKSNRADKVRYQDQIDPEMVVYSMGLEEYGVVISQYGEEVDITTHSGVSARVPVEDCVVQ